MTKRVLCSERLGVAVLVLLVFSLLSLFLLGAGAPEVEEKELTFLTWNLPHYEPQIKGMIADFEEAFPEATVEWVDVHGSEWATYFRTQVAAADPPDIVNVQGALWYQYAADGILIDITDRLNEEPEVKDRYYPHIFEAVSEFEGRYYMLPFYTPATVLYYNKPAFEQAGLPGPPETYDELIEYSRELTTNGQAGFMTLNFDWLYWSLFGYHGVEILNEDGTEAAFNTPEAVRVLEDLAELTDEGVIPGTAWTGRWAEPNDAFGAGETGMHQAHVTALRAFMADSDWADDDTVGIAPFPGNYATPNYHGLGITTGTDYPDLAWEFIKIATSEKWAKEIVPTLGSLSGNIAADELAIDEDFRREYPLAARQFDVERSEGRTLVGQTGHPDDERIKDAVYSNLQRALFGEVSAERALADAERDVNVILR